MGRKVFPGQKPAGFLHGSPAVLILFDVLRDFMWLLALMGPHLGFGGDLSLISLQQPRVLWEENLSEELFGVGWPVEMFLQQQKGNRPLPFCSLLLLYFYWRSQNDTSRFGAAVLKSRRLLESSETVPLCPPTLLSPRFSFFHGTHRNFSPPKPKAIPWSSRNPVT